MLISSAEQLPANSVAHQVREKHTTEWKILKSAADEILGRAIAQFSKEMLLESKEAMWYWISLSTGEIDNQAYSGSDMVHYLRQGQLPLNAQLCQTVGQRGIPPRSQFKTLQQLVDEYMEKRVLTRRSSSQSQVSI